MNLFNPIIIEGSSEEILSILKSELRHHNYQYFGDYERKNFTICIYDSSNILIGAIHGFCIPTYKIARAEFVWVIEKQRGQGIGTALFTKMQEHALSHKCNKLQVSTMDFQGPGFYEKLGFKCIGIAPKWFCDHDEIFMEKAL